MDDLLYQYNPWWEQAHDLSMVRPRDAQVEAILARMSEKRILFLSGLRRVGKTTLMRLKDIVAFHGLKDHQVLRDFFMLLMERGGKQVSVNKISTLFPRPCAEKGSSGLSVLFFCHGAVQNNASPCCFHF